MPGAHLTTFLRAQHAGEMTVTDVGETDFAVIVYREEDHWKAAALPLTCVFAPPAGDLSIFADLGLDEMETLDELEQQTRHGWDLPPVTCDNA